MASIVLVHGGWLGGWCWRRVAPLLAAAGHDVHTPTLTGLGDRAHLLSRGVDLSLHARDVAALLEYEDLHDVVLVGHSSGGGVIGKVANLHPRRVAHLVYLDAFLPTAGASMLELTAPAMRAAIEQAAVTNGAGWLIALDPKAAVARWGVTDPDDVEWLASRLEPLPMAVLNEPVPDVVSPNVELGYIQCTEGAAVATFGQFADRAAAHPDRWWLRTLPTGHCPMVTMPARLTELLLEATER